MKNRCLSINGDLGEANTKRGGTRESVIGTRLCDATDGHKAVLDIAIMASSDKERSIST